AADLFEVEPVEVLVFAAHSVGLHRGSLRRWAAVTPIASAFSRGPALVKIDDLWLSFGRASRYAPNAWLIRTTAGPATMMKSAGRMHRVSGKTSFTGIFMARSSA